MTVTSGVGLSPVITRLDAFLGNHSALLFDVSTDDTDELTSFVTVRLAF